MSELQLRKMIISCLSREENRIIRMLITYGAKFLSADWLRQDRYFFIIMRALLVIKMA